jgi:hypothetical protein
MNSYTLSIPNPNPLTMQKQLKIISYTSEQMIKHIGSWTMQYLTPSTSWSPRFARQQLFRYFLFYNCVEQILFDESSSEQHYTPSIYNDDTKPPVCRYFTSETSGSLISSYSNNPNPKYHFGLVLCSWLDINGTLFKSIFYNYIQSNSHLRELFLSNWPSRSLVTKYPIPIKRAAGFLCNYELTNSDCLSYTFLPRSSYLKCRSNAFLSLCNSYPSVPFDTLTSETSYL